MLVRHWITELTLKWMSTKKELEGIMIRKITSQCSLVGTNSVPSIVKCLTWADSYNLQGRFYSPYKEETAKAQRGYDLSKVSPAKKLSELTFCLVSLRRFAKRAVFSDIRLGSFKTTDVWILPVTIQSESQR